MKMIADWKLNMMCKVLFDRLWHDRKEAAERACQLIKDSYRVDRNDTSDRQKNILEEFDRLKRKRERLTELYTEDEISKAEYSDQKRKIDKSTDALNEQLNAARLEDGVERTALEPAWDKITEALNTMIDFSQPDLNADFIKKYVSRVETVSNTHFRWYLNLDGSGDTLFDCVVNGTKKNPVIIIDGDDNGPDKGRLHRKNGIIIDLFTNSEYNNGSEYVQILIFELENDIKNKKSRLVPTLHRQLLRKVGNNDPFTKVAEFVLNIDEAKAYLYKDSTKHRIYRWKDLNVNLYV